MSAPDPNLEAVGDIVRAAREIVDFVAGLDLDGFLGDIRTQGAVLHRLILVGEATKRLSIDFRAAHPDVPWTKIAGMRDVFVHAYHRVVLTRVWIIATIEIPQLSTSLQPLLNTPDD